VGPGLQKLQKKLKKDMILGIKSISWLYDGWTETKEKKTFWKKGLP